MSRKRLLAVVVAGSTAITTACGIGAGATPTGAALLVTQGFGVQTLLQSRAPKVSGADTVMRLLERNATVTTRYGGGFVESIDGRSGGTQNGQPDDWFLYVNGVQTGKGAAATKVHDGDHIWWDRHVWAATENIPAVVGSFPEPFLDGYGGTHYPIRVECTQPHTKACDKVYGTLGADQIVVGLGCLDCAAYNKSLRVVVGPYSTLAIDRTADLLRGSPSASGVYARFVDGGHKLELLGQTGQVVKTLGPGAGLIAATRMNGAPPVWFVTGTDAAGVAAAVQAFNAGTLDGHFAVAIANDIAQPLPLGGP